MSCSPWTHTSPDTRQPLDGRRPRIALPMTLLPLPDSPTIARVLPRSRDRLTPSTAVAALLLLTNETDRFRTSRRCDLVAVCSSRCTSEDDGERRSRRWRDTGELCRDGLCMPEAVGRSAAPGVGERVAGRERG